MYFYSRLYLVSGLDIHQWRLVSLQSDTNWPYLNEPFTLGFEVVNGWYIISQYVNKGQYVNDEGKEVVNTGYTLHGTTSMSGCQSIFPCGTSLLYTQQLGLEAPEYAGF